MRRKSKKVLDAESFVDGFLEMYGEPPTYEELAKGLGISKTAAYSKCTKFKEKMKVSESTMRKHSGVTRIQLDLYVPNEKFKQFASLLSQMKKFLSNTATT